MKFRIATGCEIKYLPNLFFYKWQPIELSTQIIKEAENIEILALVRKYDNHDILIDRDEVDILLQQEAFAIMCSKEDANVFLDCFVDLILRARSNTYGTNPDLFTQDINRLIDLKRLFFEREIVLTTPKLYN